VDEMLDGTGTLDAVMDDPVINATLAAGAAAA
jgi:hypothetical protein